MMITGADYPRAFSRLRLQLLRVVHLTDSNQEPLHSEGLVPSRPERISIAKHFAINRVENHCSCGGLER